MIGRRVSSFAEIEQPGDYFGPATGFDDGKETCFYRGPSCGHLGRVTFPLHTYRECPEWHGYLDEGHVWRQV